MLEKLFANIVSEFAIHCLAIPIAASKSFTKLSNAIQSISANDLHIVLLASKIASNSEGKIANKSAAGKAKASEKQSISRASRESFNSCKSSTNLPVCVFKQSVNKLLGGVTGGFTRIFRVT